MAQPKQGHIGIIGFRDVLKRCVDDYIDSAGGRLFHRLRDQGEGIQKLWASGGSILPTWRNVSPVGVFVGGVLSTLSAWVIWITVLCGWVRAEAEGINFPSACIYGTTKIMKKSIMVAPKKRRGRPSTGGRDPHVSIRMPQALIEEADAWAAAGNVGRSEALRRLVELGLKAKAAKSGA